MRLGVRSMPKKVLFISLLSCFVVWTLINMSDGEVERQRRVSPNSTGPVAVGKFPSKNDSLFSTGDGNPCGGDHNSPSLPGGRTSSIPHLGSHRISSSEPSSKIKPLDQEIYGNNFLEELVLVGANTDTLYRETESLWRRGDHPSEALLNLLNMGYRYFELTAIYDPDSRLYHWYLPSEQMTYTEKREISKDIRQICQFAKNHSEEVFIFALSFCTTNCYGPENNDKDQTWKLFPGNARDWTRASPERSRSDGIRSESNRTLYSNPSQIAKEFNLMDVLFSEQERPIVEEPIASHFLSVVGSLVKKCALLADVPLTRTVSEILSTKRNVVFTVYSPNFLIPLTLQRIFRQDEILRRSVWSGISVETTHFQRTDFEWLFPELSNLDNSRFFNQPSSLSHLRLMLSSHSGISWMGKWNGMVSIPVGRAAFEMSLILLTGFLLLFFIKGSFRQNKLNGMRFDSPAKAVLKRSRWSIPLANLSYALFFVCVFLVSYYAYHCIPGVVLTFSDPIRDSGEPENHNETAIQSDNHSTLDRFGFSTKTSADSDNDVYGKLCNSIASTFRRWLVRPYGRRVNIVSVAAGLQRPIFSIRHNRPMKNTTSYNLKEVDICTEELVRFAAKANYNQLKKYLLVKHSGTPLSGRKSRDFSACPQITFGFEVKSEGRLCRSGTLEEGDELILEDNGFPGNAELTIHAKLQEFGSKVFLYSESLRNLLKQELDVFLRGTNFNTVSNFGFAYVSSRPDLTTSSCYIEDLDKSPSTLKVTSWNSYNAEMS